MSDFTVTFEPAPQSPVVPSGSRNHRIASVLLWVLFGVQVALVVAGYVLAVLIERPYDIETAAALYELPSTVTGLLYASVIAFAAVGVRRGVRLARYVAFGVAFVGEWGFIERLGWFASTVLRWSDTGTWSFLPLLESVPAAVLGVIVFVLLVRREPQVPVAGVS
ncbi:hypothetical protein Afil01_43330 [Actinorhabdospora filicis]|uniref:Uncharacterized protein n=1 Tax=Actinorhabdospora filicis TaxID=1785913 RepID=A0A9W6SRQ3_9ACTN|nr:hypothetical protein [Actinorhabdospora filicis]GLZ79526.1 hypothetical protein Afil01_43330 [Actinorhabdospora filicis]